MIKKLMLLMAGVAILLGCTHPQPTHTIQTNGQDSVVYVQVPSQDGTMQNFYMNYLMFQMLMNSGGYNNVNHYYNTHITEFRQTERKYSNYKPIYRPEPPRPKISTSSPSRSYDVKSSSSPSRSTWSSPSSGGSSPSRSYSKPSSSPSRSYSSPSRSSSSPSRSSSSPSRRK